MKTEMYMINQNHNKCADDGEFQLKINQNLNALIFCQLSFTVANKLLPSYLGNQQLMTRSSLMLYTAQFLRQ